MSDKPPYDVSIAKITSEEELQKIYDACHELAEKTEEELTPLLVQYADLTARVDHLQRTFTLAQGKANVVKEKLDATKALKAFTFKCWYQVADDSNLFFYPVRKNASNRVSGFRVEKCKMSTWENFIWGQKAFTGKEYWRLCETTMSGADCEKFSRLSHMVLTGRNVETDLEEMRKLRDRTRYSTTFAIIKGRVEKLDK